MTYYEIHTLLCCLKYIPWKRLCDWVLISEYLIEEIDSFQLQNCSSLFSFEFEFRVEERVCAINLSCKVVNNKTDEVENNGKNMLCMQRNVNPVPCTDSHCNGLIKVIEMFSDWFTAWPCVQSETEVKVRRDLFFEMLESPKLLLIT